MRIFLEIAVLALLVYFGWDRSFSEYLSPSASSVPPAAPARAAAPGAVRPAAATPLPLNRSWMFQDEGSLDRKAYGGKGGH